MKTYHNFYNQIPQEIIMISKHFFILSSLILSVFAVSAMEREVTREKAYITTVPKVAGWPTQINLHTHILYTENNQEIGFIEYYADLDDTFDPSWYDIMIRKLSLSPEFKGMGYEQILISRACKYALDSKYPIQQIRTEDLLYDTHQNAATFAAYRALGFSISEYSRRPARPKPYIPTLEGIPGQMIDRPDDNQKALREKLAIIAAQTPTVRD